MASIRLKWAMKYLTITIITPSHGSFFNMSSYVTFLSCIKATATLHYAAASNWMLTSSLTTESVRIRYMKVKLVTLHTFTIVKYCNCLNRFASRFSSTASQNVRKEARTISTHLQVGSITCGKNSATETVLLTRAWTESTHKCEPSNRKNHGYD